MRLCEQPSKMQYAYELDGSIEDKINAIATRIYRADGVDFTAQAKKQIAKLAELGFSGLPICMAKTQYSFSDDAAKVGAPEGFRITVRNVKVSAGAGFIVALTGDIMTMPGLPKKPAALGIDVDESGEDNWVVLIKIIRYRVRQAFRTRFFIRKSFVLFCEEQASLSMTCGAAFKRETAFAVSRLKVARVRELSFCAVKPRKNLRRIRTFDLKLLGVSAQTFLLIPVFSYYFLHITCAVRRTYSPLCSTKTE